MAEKKGNETAGDLVDSLREANQAVAQSIVATQERYMKFAQSIFTIWMEGAKSQAESTRQLIEVLGQQNQQQQAAFQRLVHESMEISIDFLFAPLSFYRQAVQAAETAPR